MQDSHGEPPLPQHQNGSSGLLALDYASSHSLGQVEQEYGAWLRSRTICIECQSILHLLYREWVPTDINSVLPTNYNLSALCSSAQQCPTCELFLTDFNSHDFKEADIQVWGNRDIIASPIRWPNTDLRGIRLEVWNPRTREILEIASLHLVKPGIFMIIHPLTICSNS
jgi:hypothetical protein